MHLRKRVKRAAIVLGGVGTAAGGGLLSGLNKAAGAAVALDSAFSLVGRGANLVRGAWDGLLSVGSALWDMLGRITDGLRAGGAALVDYATDAVMLQADMGRIEQKIRVTTDFTEAENEAIAAQVERVSTLSTNALGAVDLQLAVLKQAQQGVDSSAIVEGLEAGASSATLYGEELAKVLVVNEQFRLKTHNKIRIV